MSDGFAATNPLLISSAQARAAVSEALRLYIGRGRRYSQVQIANATGVREWEIKFALLPVEDPAHRPLKQEALMSIGLFLGGDFINEWVHLMEVGCFDLPDTDYDPGLIAAENTEDNAKLVRAAVDLVFDDDEKPNLVQVGNRMMHRGAQLVALGRTLPPKSKGE